MLTDGLSQDRVSRPSFVLRRSGVNTFVVAIGRRTNRRQLLQIASSSRNIYRTSFRRLNYIVRSITRRVCKSRGEFAKLGSWCPERKASKISHCLQAFGLIKFLVNYVYLLGCYSSSGFSLCTLCVLTMIFSTSKHA